jgi:hypothetical protein
MTTPTPPKLPLWLLERVRSGHHSDPLVGDLIEEYGRGRGRAWFWRQVLVAILVSTQRAAPRILQATRRVLLRLAAEASAVLTIVTIVEQSRRMHGLGTMWTPGFIETVAFLAAFALIAFLLSRPRSGSGRRRTLINRVAAVFAVVALGAGTLTWADAVRSTCKTDTCLCSKFEPGSITPANH